MKNQQELIDEYLYYCLKQRKLDEKTVRAYRIDLRQFSEFCVQKKLVTEKAIIRQYILHLHESYKQKTVKRKVASIKAFYSYLEDEEIIDDSPLRKIRTEFREEKILPRSIPYSILQSLLSSMYSKKSIESTLLSSDNICLVVYDSEKNIQAGYCIFTTSFEDADLCRIAVLNDYRRNHLADRMLKKAFEKLETNGVKRVLLEVREGNNAAITLYKKYGFEQIGKRKNYYSEPAEDGLVFEASLSASYYHCTL